MEVFGDYSASEDSMAPLVTGPLGQVVRLFAETNEGATGPITKNFYQDWLPPVTNVLYLVWPSNTSEAEFCENITSIPHTERLTVQVDSIVVLKHVYGMIGFILALKLVNSIVLLYATVKHNEIVSLLKFDKVTGIVQELS